MAHSYRPRFRRARRARGGTPRTEGVFPPCVPPPVPPGHVDRDPNICGAFIRAANRARYQTAIRTAFRSPIQGVWRASSRARSRCRQQHRQAGREQPPNRVRDGCPGKTGGLLTPRIHCRRRRETAVARHRTPRGLRTMHVCNLHALSHLIAGRGSSAFALSRRNSSTLTLLSERQPPLFVAATLAASAVHKLTRHDWPGAPSRPQPQRPSDMIRSRGPLRGRYTSQTDRPSYLRQGLVRGLDLSRDDPRGGGDHRRQG